MNTNNYSQRDRAHGVHLCVWSQAPIVTHKWLPHALRQIAALGFIKILRRKNMKKSYLKTTGVLILSVLLNTASAETPRKAIVIQRLHVDDYNSGTSSGVRKQHKILHSESEYREELANYSNAANPVPLDFKEGIVLLIDFGNRSSGGYKIELDTKIDVTENYLKLKVFYQSSCVQTQLTTNPYAFFYIPTKKELLINEYWVTPCAS